LRLSGLTIFLLPLALGLACNAGQQSTPTVCAPGQQVACACPGGALGAQACRGDGSGYGACTGCSGGSGGGGVGGQSSGGAGGGIGGTAGASAGSGGGDQVPSCVPGGPELDAWGCGADRPPHYFSCGVHPGLAPMEGCTADAHCQGFCCPKKCALVTSAANACGPSLVLAVCDAGNADPGCQEWLPDGGSPYSYCCPSGVLPAPPDSLLGCGGAYGQGGGGGVGGAPQGGAGGNGGYGGSAQQGGAGGVGGQPDGGGSGWTDGTGGGAATCYLRTNKPACDDCLQTMCLSECSTCVEWYSQCAPLLDCIANCPGGESQCVSNCSAQYPGGVDQLVALLGPQGCVATQCAAECAGVVAKDFCSTGDPCSGMGHTFCGSSFTFDCGVNMCGCDDVGSFSCCASPCAPFVSKDALCPSGMHWLSCFEVAPAPVQGCVAAPGSPNDYCCP